jgi:chromosome partitioning protein
VTAGPRGLGWPVQPEQEGDRSRSDVAPGPGRPVQPAQPVQPEQAEPGDRADGMRRVGRIEQVDRIQRVDRIERDETFAAGGSGKSSGRGEPHAAGAAAHADGLGWPTTSPGPAPRVVLTGPAAPGVAVPGEVTGDAAMVSRETGPDRSAGRQDGEMDMAERRAAAGRTGLEAESPGSPGGTATGWPGSTPEVGDFGVGRRARDESDMVTPIVAEPTSASDTPIARAARAALAARTGSPAWPRPRACRLITIANQKGGVGKTTTAVNLAASLSLHGARVLVIDLDPQGNASTALDVDHHSGTASIYNVLVDGQPLANVVRPAASIAHLYCAPATIDLAGAEIELVPLVARESRLVRALAGFDSSGLDYIFIDCPPSLGLLTVNALVAAPEVLIPIQCEYYALEGLEQLLRTVDLVRSHLNPGLAVSTILLTMFDGRTRLASQVADEVREHFGEIVLNSVIPRSVRVSEAPSYGQSVMTYDPGSSGAQAYLEAAKEMAYRDAPRT